MKKFSILIALALCVTVGGVYATWNYMTVESAAEQSGAVSMGLTDRVIETAQGTLAVTVHDDAKIFVDQKDDAYHAKLLFEGTVTVTFTSNNPDLTADGVDVIYGISPVSLTFEGTPVFTVSEEKLPLQLTKTEAGIYSGTIEITELEKLIAISESLVLDTVEKYDAFAAVIAGATFELVVSAAE